MVSNWVSDMGYHNIGLICLLLLQKCLFVRCVVRINKGKDSMAVVKFCTNLDRRQCPESNQWKFRQNSEPNSNNYCTLMTTQNKTWVRIGVRVSVRAAKYSRRCLWWIWEHRSLAKILNGHISAMKRLDRVWNQTNLSLSAKIRIYSTCMLAVLLYGSETWTLTQPDWKRLDSFHTRSQRRILHIR